MNIQELDILNSLAEEPFVNQRLLAQRCGRSLGAVNRALRTLAQAGCVDENTALTEKARAMLAAGAPKNAVILAAAAACGWCPSTWRRPRDCWRWAASR